MTVPLDIYVMHRTKTATKTVQRTRAGSPTASGVLFSVQPMTAREQDVYNRRDIKADYKLYSHYNFKADVNFPLGLTLAYVLVDPALGYEYDVMGVEESRNSRMRRPLVYKVIAQRIIL